MIGPTDKPTLLIAEDDFIIREGMLKYLLKPHFTIVACVDNGRDAVAAAAAHKPRIALLDVSLPEISGFEAARQIVAANHDCKVLLVSNYAERAYPGTAKELGASGYVLKSRVGTDLLPAIEAALAERFYQSTF